MNRNTFQKAFAASLPVMAGYLVIGFGFGILLRDAGYGIGWAAAMSTFIYAGSMQYAGVSLITAPASLLTCALTTFLVNARHLFYSISLLEKYRGAGRYKPYLIFALTDETYALVSSDHEERGKEQFPFYFLVSLLNHLYWIAGTLLGSAFAAALPFDTRGIGFSMTALFAAAYTQQWKSGENRIPALLGLLLTFAARLVFGRDLFLIPAMIAITAALLLLRPRLSAKEEH